MMTCNRQQEFDAIAVAVDAAVSDNTTGLDTFYQWASQFFLSASNGKTYSRRPPLGFKLVCGGFPHARIAIRPAWSSWRKEVIPTTVEIELLVEIHASEAARTELIGGDPQYADVKLSTVESVLGFNLTPGRIKRHKIYFIHAVDGVKRMIDTINQFVVCPEEVFARSSDHCCICGRALSDDVSRTRGIGPECAATLQCMYIAHRRETLFA